MIYINAKFGAACIVHLERKEGEDQKRGTELFQFRFLDCVVHAFLSQEGRETTIKATLISRPVSACKPSLPSSLSPCYTKQPRD